MPVRRLEDNDGPYYQWGNSGKKYRYTSGNKKSRDMARDMAAKQGQAVHAAGYKE